MADAITAIVITEDQAHALREAAGWDAREELRRASDALAEYIEPREAVRNQLLDTITHVRAALHTLEGMAAFPHPGDEEGN